jgi:retron-type reverse transcriptase
MLYKYQSAFRKNYSTQSACILLLNSIYNNLEANKHICLIILDLTKAFDLINHAILLTNLQTQFKYSNMATHFIKSYLKDRKQYTKINNSSSKEISTNIGVPQGSILGPSFFSYI